MYLALFSKETAFASGAALLIGLILGAKIMLFIAKVFGSIMGPSAYRNQGGQYGHRNGNRDYENSNGLTSVLLFLLFIGFLAFMVKSFIGNFFVDNKTNKQEVSGLSLVSATQTKSDKLEHHPVVETPTPILPDEHIPDFVTVQNESPNEKEMTLSEYGAPQQSVASASYIIKVGVYREWANAAHKIHELENLGANAAHYVTDLNGEDVFAVYVGGYESAAAATAGQKALHLKGSVVISGY